jgi:RNA polymerase sigma factor (sigma-70 family)
VIPAGDRIGDAAEDLRGPSRDADPVHSDALRTEEPTMVVIATDRPGGRVVDFRKVPGSEPARRPSPERFAAVVDPLRGDLVRLARRILHCDDLAQDAVQEALLGLWLARPFPPNPAAWLIRAVVLRSLRINRSRSRRRKHEERACSCRPEADPRGDATRTLEVEELGIRIRTALDTLPEPYRTVFLLREVERLDYEAIAATLQVPVGTVRSRLHRSRDALQEALRRDVRTGDDGGADLLLLGVGHLPGGRGGRPAGASPRNRLGTIAARAGLSLQTGTAGSAGTAGRTAHN